MIFLIINDKCNDCPFAENKMTNLNYGPNECRHPQISPVVPKSEFGQVSKQAGDECFDQAILQGSA